MFILSKLMFIFYQKEAERLNTGRRMKVSIQTG